MTLVLAIFNEAGAVLAADGVGTYGQMVGAQQVPWEKLSVLGDRCACGQVGDLTKTQRLVDALEASPLGSEPTLSRPAEEWLNIARKTVGAWSNEYLQRVVWNAQLPLQQQFQEASLVLTGTAQDRSFAYTVSWLGTYEDPEADHYTAAGSGAVSARIYLDAYSYFDVVGHPVLTLQALAARVLRKVSENNIEIGGELSMVTIHRDVSDEHPSATSACRLLILGCRPPLGTGS